MQQDVRRKKMTKNIDIICNKTKPIIEVLSEHQSIKGVLCFGSYAMGTYDEYSDIDLYVFCDPVILPSPIRQNTFQKINGIKKLQIDHVEFGWDTQWNPQGDRFLCNGIQFDITYNTIDWIQTVVNKVKNDGATSIPELQFRPYTMLGLLENSVLVYDPESVLRDIKSGLHPYPPKLRKNLLLQNMEMIRDSLEDLKDYNRRNIGNTAFHFHLGRIIDSLGTILFALNGRYDPATKRVEEAYRKLKIIPKDFLRRYNLLLETPLNPEGRKKVITELQNFVDEIDNLKHKKTE